MRLLPVIFSLVATFAVSSCTQKEQELEPDYDNMVMADEEDGFSPGDLERDRKVIAGELPDPRELLLLESLTPSQDIQR